MPLPQFLVNTTVPFTGAQYPVMFQISDGFLALESLTEKLEELLPDIDNRRVRKISYCENLGGV